LFENVVATGVSQSAKVTAIKDFIVNTDSQTKFNIAGLSFGDIFGKTSGPTNVGYILIGAGLESFVEAF
jgi:hypothetical protein